jgi:hypothetical protein
MNAVTVLTSPGPGGPGHPCPWNDPGGGVGKAGRGSTGSRACRGGVLSLRRTHQGRAGGDFLIVHRG